MLADLSFCQFVINHFLFILHAKLYVMKTHLIALVRPRLWRPHPPTQSHETVCFGGSERKRDQPNTREHNAQKVTVTTAPWRNVPNLTQDGLVSNGDIIFRQFPYSWCSKCLTLKEWFYIYFFICARIKTKRWYRSCASVKCETTANSLSWTKDRLACPLWKTSKFACQLKLRVKMIFRDGI